MSNNSAQKVRRNASPASSKQGPMKATLQFSLMQGSPTRTNGRKCSPCSSPTPTKGSDRVKTRRSPDSRLSPERRSPNSPGIKVERPKAIRSSPSQAIRRTGSLDAIAGPYLTGQWPRESMFSVPGMSDKSTQTPKEWDEADKDKKKKHKRSASVGNGEQQLAAIYRQRLQRTKEGSKQCVTSSQRHSPIQGNHSAIHQPPTHHTISKAIGIPGTHIPKAGVPRTRGSYEGLNEEIEKLGLRSFSGQDEELQVQEPTPDGHRAPVLELIRSSSTRSVDTQTPSGYIDLDNNNSGNSSRSHSISPTFPIIPAGPMDNSRPSSGSEPPEVTAKEMDSQVDPKMKAIKDSDIDAGEVESPEPQPLAKSAISPRPNKSYAFVREPPDGCEKVNIINEPKRAAPPALKEPLLFCPIQQSQFVLKPSDQSAFLPFYTKMMKSPVTPTALSSIESQ